MTRLRAAVALCATAVTCAASSCTSGPVGSPGADKAGGRAGPIVLRLAEVGNGPFGALAYFGRRVDGDSHGRVRVSFVTEFGSYAADAERQVVAAVAAGKVDLGWVGSRAFDSLGVSSLSALSAPMLIEDIRLEDAVLAGPMGQQMLAGLAPAGVTGVAALPGDITVPVGVDRALVAPERWQGIAFGTYASRVQEQAVRALGATPVEVFGPLRNQALSVHAIAGFAADIHFYAGLGVASQAPYITANVGLWPDVAVVVANPGVFSDLTQQQRRWLEDAARETTAFTRGFSIDRTAAVQAACAQGARFVMATPSQLAAFRGPFAAVYADLQKDRQTRSFIMAIRRLKATMPPAEPLDIPPGCSGTQ